MFFDMLKFFLQELLDPLSYCSKGDKIHLEASWLVNLKNSKGFQCEILQAVGDPPWKNPSAQPRHGSVSDSLLETLDGDFLDCWWVLISR